MRVYVPFTRLSALTYKALRDVAEFVPLLDKEYGYGEYFKSRWEQGAPFINVEHDMVPSLSVLQSMWNCPNPFCLSGYSYPDQPLRVDIAYLGCAKISASMISDNPGAFDLPTRWNECDTQIWRATGETYCQHGSVLHLHVDSLWPKDAVEKYGR